mgnify:CR=1 FL=1
MSDNMANIIGHFEDFSPNNKHIQKSLSRFVQNPFEKKGMNSGVKVILIIFGFFFNLSIGICLICHFSVLLS